MATVSNPVMAFKATIQAGRAMTQSGNDYYSLNLTQELEIFIPLHFLQPNTTGISAGPELHAYRSHDGGVAYDTIPWAVMSIARAANANDKGTLRLETGQYLLRVIPGGGNNSIFWSYDILSQELITAILNV